MLAGLEVILVAIITGIVLVILLADYWRQIGAGLFALAFLAAFAWFALTDHGTPLLYIAGGWLAFLFLAAVTQDRR